MAGFWYVVGYRLPFRALHALATAVATRISGAGLHQRQTEQRLEAVAAIRATRQHLRRQGQAEKEGNYEKQTFHGAKIRLSESKSKEKSEKLFSLLCRAEVSKTATRYT